MQLRPYQIEIIDKCRNLMRSGNKSILIQSPTGSGKTLLTAFMLKTAAEKGMVSWFIVHRRELIKQSMEQFKFVGLHHGVISANFDSRPNQLVQICSVQTLSRRHQKYRKPNLIVWDETHHIASNSWSTIHSHYSDSFHVGLSATPERLDGTGLNKWYGNMIHGPSVSWLIENKFLSPYRLFAPSNVSMAGIHIKRGDYDKTELSNAMDKPSITGNAINEYKKFANGKRAVIFCVSIEHSKHVVAQFQAAGINAAHVDGETNVIERDNAIEKFRQGEIHVLSNVELFGEGFDLPAIEVAILLRPTQSLGLYLQQVGRVLRQSPGKEEALILDHVGNVSRHGLPDDDRNWSLAGRDKRKQTSDEPSESVKICKKCFSAQRPGPPNCRYCGEPFEIKPRIVKNVDGELSEIDIQKIRNLKRREQGMAQSMNDLIAIGKQRGYKRPYLWAKFVFNARQRKRIGVIA